MTAMHGEGDWKPEVMFWSLNEFLEFVSKKDGRTVLFCVTLYAILVVKITLKYPIILTFPPKREPVTIHPPCLYIFCSAILASIFAF